LPARFDPRTGTLTGLGLVVDSLRPTWAVRHPRLPIVYFTEESGGDGVSQGGVQAWRIDTRTGALTKISDVRAGGGGTTNLWFDARSDTILAVNYGGGQIVTMAANRDGTLGSVVSQVQLAGKGPHRRQASAHPHGVTVDPSGRWVIVPDLGADRIWVFPFDPATRQIGADDPAALHHVALYPGTGPRHLAFHPTGKWAYLAEELTASVTTFAWDAQTGHLTKPQILATDGPADTGDPSVAEVAVSRDGRFVYVSNRGDHALVVHAVDPGLGTLRPIQRIASGGPLPWHFALHPGGRWLLVANRDADAVALFRINPASGRLSDTGTRLATPKPVHVGLTGLGG
jgi:6-phosphogluconolactonase